ncbi:MAG: DUF4115 domain-containing protein [Firmicutes bacterium]|nr:DUF4115 domain-containing protein [Bacillota bacterium]
MKEIGTFLKDEREARGITMDQLRDGTKIRTRYLEAIEQGDFDAIPGEVYLKGFIRSYAECIGLDGQEVVARYNGLKRAQEVSMLREVERERASRVQRVQREVRLRRSARAIRFLATLLFVGFLGVAFYLGAVALGIVEWGPQTPKEATSDEIGKGAASRAGATEALSQDKVTPGAQVTPAPAPAEGDRVPGSSTGPSPSGHTLRIHTTEQCWVRVWEDGRLVREGILKPGDSVVFQASTEIRARVGNAGGIRLEFNGIDLGVPGRPGQVVDIVLPPPTGPEGP